MKYASFMGSNGVTSWGVAAGDEIVDLGPSGANIAPTLKAAIVANALPTSTESLNGARRVAADDLTFLPPITDAGKVICVGVNYAAHRDEGSKPQAAAPTIFTRFADTQIGHRADVIRPFEDSQFDYEGELALVVSKDAWHVDAADAFDYIAGYAPYNDFSVRDWQRSGGQWTPGKNFPATGAFGPYLVSRDDIADVEQLQLRTIVNGEVRQSASLADLIFDIPQLIEYVTKFTPLAAGDIIVTGTPGGVGIFMDPPGLLSDGDVVEVHIDGVGVLENVVRDA